MMNEMGIYANLSGHDKGYSSYKGKVGKTAPNLLNRDFNAEHSLEKAGTDVTKFKFDWSKVYLSPIIDFYNDEILGYALSLSPNMKMINDMLDDMYSKHPLTYNMMLHSDQGWQYQMESYQENLKSHGIIQSMSRKGNCLDNSKTENFFSKLKKELFTDMKKNSTTSRNSKRRLTNILNGTTTNALSRGSAVLLFATGALHIPQCCAIVLFKVQH